MNRNREQAELIFQLGQLFGPALMMAKSPNSYDADERTRIMARFFSERPQFIQAWQRFCNGEPGHSYVIEFNRAQHHLFEIQTRASKSNVTERELFELLQESAPLILDVILSIPVPVDSTIHEARTPFSTYCFLKDLCSTVKNDIVWLDRYFDQAIFHRFFSETTSTVQITLVTRPLSSLRGKADAQRYNEFMDISKLFAQERGPTGYRLIQNDNFHDRWLRCDGRLFVLGGSIKDLAKPFTVSKLDSTPDNLKHFDDVIANGVEVFGPSQTTDP